jgi:PAS domain S-box-containing protein
MASGQTADEREARELIASAIHAQEEIALKALESLADGVIVINAQGIIVLFNLRAEMMFGYSRDEVVGQPVEVLLPESLRTRHVEHRRLYFDEPSVREMGTGLILKARHKDGRERNVQIRLSSFPVTGAGIHAVAVVRSIKGASVEVNRDPH